MQATNKFMSAFLTQVIFTTPQLISTQISKKLAVILWLKNQLEDYLV